MIHKGYSLSSTVDQIVASHIRLWRTVIKHAIDDFHAGHLRVRYFTSRDFKMVCEFARTTPEAALEHSGINDVLVVKR